MQEVNLPGRDGLVKFEGDGTWFPSDPVWFIYHDLEPDDQKEQLALLRYGNSACLTGEAAYEAWRDIPTTYIRQQRIDGCRPIFKTSVLKMPPLPKYLSVWRS